MNDRAAVTLGATAVITLTHFHKRDATLNWLLQDP